ncbi:MAG: phosphatidylglycerol lysyltransferase domain-containing protein [Bacillota bacterium]|nr:phosphatidylglycerol lysyltransferase domain-containing protein [Bacillota bacterium]
MIEFKKITIEDRDKVNEYLSKSGRYNTESSFGILYLWKDVYDTHIAFMDGFLVVRLFRNGEMLFYQPCGSGNIISVIEKLKNYAEEKGEKLRIVCASAEFSKKVSENFQVEVTEKRDYFDYLYLSSDLANLQGKKFHAKRNHINKFMTIHTSEFVPITAENKGLVQEINRKWCRENDMCAEETIKFERCALENLIDHMDELKGRGLIAFVDGSPAGFTAGTPQYDGSDMFIVHFEKALSGFEGTYAAINNQFALALEPNYKYLNREDDVGIEGLRKAKLSYNPVKLVEKFEIVF